jgi:EAL domain-containing protein (putative c-di-GMP-specific phosphodiesterase class I)
VHHFAIAVEDALWLRAAPHPGNGHVRQGCGEATRKKTASLPRHRHRICGSLPSRVELEVTEDILVDDEKAVDLFHKIRQLGVRIVLDDFGTGYASLSYLKKFPLNGIKIDRSFVRQLGADLDDSAIVSSIIGLSTLLGLSVVAEGIEDRGTANLLTRMGCKLGQG